MWPTGRPGKLSDQPSKSPRMHLDATAWDLANIENLQNWVHKKIAVFMDNTCMATGQVRPGIVHACVSSVISNQDCIKVLSTGGFPRGRTRQKNSSTQSPIWTIVGLIPGLVEVTCKGYLRFLRKENRPSETG